MYLDVKMFRKIGNEDTKNITELNSEIKISFVVPEKYINTDEKLYWGFYVAIHCLERTRRRCFIGGVTSVPLFHRVCHPIHPPV